MRFILVVALLGFLSPLSYAASITNARTHCADISKAGVHIAEAKERGAAKHVLVDRVHALYQEGEFTQPEANTILGIIEYVYQSPESPDSIQGPMFRQCLKELGFNET